MNLPLVIKPHPQYPLTDNYVIKQCRILDPQSDGVEAVAKASFVITTGSTIALESLILGKPTVILPSNSGVAYQNCPMLGKNYTEENIVYMLNQHKNKEREINDYLDLVAANWHDYNAADKAFELIKELSCLD